MVDAQGGGEEGALVWGEFVDGFCGVGAVGGPGGGGVVGRGREVGGCGAGGGGCVRVAGWVGGGALVSASRALWERCAWFDCERREEVEDGCFVAGERTGWEESCRHGGWLCRVEVVR